MCKLNIEDIKYCIEEFKPEGYYNTPYGEAIKKIQKRGKTITDLQEVLYQHFLTRVIEGINKLEDYEIHTTRSNHLIFDLNNYSLPPEEIEINGDEAKEQAIKYIIAQGRGK
jgi:hypothetical protein